MRASWYAAIPVTPYAQRFSARQPPPKASVEISLDTHFSSSVVRRNGAIWGAHTAGLPTSQHSAVRWFQVDSATNRLLQDGVIASDDTNYFYPSIAVNDAGDVVVGFNGSSETEFISS